MENNEFLFEKMFASQIAKMASFPEEILMALISKKELLKERVMFLGLDINESSFLPVIPTRKMKAIEQVAHLVYYSQSQGAISDIYHCHLNGFFYNEPKAIDFSPVQEVGYIIDIKTFPLSIFPNKTYRNGSALRENVEKKGYIPANHTESLMLACQTNLLPHSQEFCALSFSWEEYEFAKVCHGRDLRYVLDWITPSNEALKIIQADYVFVPAYKEFV